MKPGDKYPVNLNEFVVAEAVVVDIEDGKATLDIPATRIVMGVKTSLSDLPEEVPNREKILLDEAPAPTVTPTVPQAPNTQGENGQVAPEQPTVGDVQPPQPPPAVTTNTANAIPADAVGEGLAGVALKEMD